MLSIKNNIPNINEFMFSIIIIANPLAWIINIPNGLAYIVLLSFFVIFLYNINSFFKGLNPRILFLIIWIYLFFFISSLKSNFNPQTIDYLIIFTVLGVIPLLISTIQVDKNKIIKYVTYFGLLFIPFAINFDINNYDTSLYDNFGGYIMGVSYGLLRFIVAASIMIIMFPVTIKYKIFLIVEIIGLNVFMLTYGTRGAILSIFLLLYLLFVIKKTKVKSDNFLAYSIVILIIFTVISYVFITFYYLNNSDNLSFRFIDKIIRLSEEGDISNGRTNIIEIAVSKIIDSPIFGNAIGSFDNYSGVYPHNLFVQFLYEGGVLLTVPLLIVIIKAIKIIITNKYSYENKLFIIFLFFSSVIELMFSSYPWISQIFWLLIGTTINTRQKNSLYKYKNQ